MCRLLRYDQIRHRALQVGTFLACSCCTYNLHYSRAMLSFSLRWKIYYHGRILKKLEGLSLTPDWSERKVALFQHESGVKWTRAGNGREPHHGRRGGEKGVMRVVWPRGITEEHALSGMRYRRMVVSWTRYAKFEPWHPSKCNLKQICMIYAIRSKCMLYAIQLCIFKT